MIKLNGLEWDDDEFDLFAVHNSSVILPTYEFKKNISKKILPSETLSFKPMLWTFPC